MNGNTIGVSHKEIRENYYRSLAELPSNLLAAIFKLNGLTQDDKQIFLCLCVCQGNNQDTNVGSKYIGVVTERNSKAVKRALRHLRELGLVTVTRCNDGPYGRECKHYKAESEMLVAEFEKDIRTSTTIIEE